MSAAIDIMREGQAIDVANAMLDAVKIHETLSGQWFDPTHPNARPELRRVAASKAFLSATWKQLGGRERALIDRLITRLLEVAAERLREIELLAQPREPQPARLLP